MRLELKHDRAVAGTSVWQFEVSAGGASRVLSEMRVLR
jgi:hypothetical protein